MTGNQRHSKANRGIPLAVLILGLFMLLSWGCTPDPAEAKNFKTLFDHYRGRDGVEAIGFPPGLAAVFLDENDPEMGGLKKLMQELTSFNMLVFDGEEEPAQEIKQNLSSYTSRNGFQDLLRIQAKDQDIFIRILEKEGNVREAVIMMYSDEDLFVIDLRGNISMDHLMKLAEGDVLGGLTSLAGVSR